MQRRFSPFLFDDFMRVFGVLKKSKSSSYSGFSFRLSPDRMPNNCFQPLQLRSGRTKQFWYVYTDACIVIAIVVSLVSITNVLIRFFSSPCILSDSE